MLRRYAVVLTPRFGSNLSPTHRYGDTLTEVRSILEEVLAPFSDQEVFEVFDRLENRPVSFKVRTVIDFT